MFIRQKISPVIILILTALLCLTGCFREKREYKLELIVRHAPSGYWQQVYLGAKAAATHYGAEIAYLGPQIDRMEQKEILEKSIERKPDAIILAAADYNSMVEPMEQVVAAGIDVIMVDSAINSDKWISFVSSDNLKLGADLATRVISGIDKPGSIGVIDFIEGTYPFIEREEGFSSVMSGSDNVSLLDIVYCDRSDVIAEQLAEDMIRENPDLRAIAGMNGSCTIGAARAIEKLGRTDIMLAGIDLVLDGVNYLEQGVIDVAIIQNPYLMGYYSVETAMQHLTGKDVERYIFTETRVVDKDNIFTKENQQLVFPFDNIIQN